jgi:crcB protein
MVLFAIALGGATGSCLRYLITIWSGGVPFPLGTLISNVLAGLLIGLVLELDRATSCFPTPIRLMLTTGFMGGLSTFSTFSVETIALFQSGKLAHAFANIGLNLFLSLGGVLLGGWLPRLFLR